MHVYKHAKKVVSNSLKLHVHVQCSCGFCRSATVVDSALCLSDRRVKLTVLGKFF